MYVKFWARVGPREGSREEILLNFSVSPKCGGKIVETQRSFGFEDSGGIVYRIGCEKCDYEIHSETIDL